MDQKLSICYLLPHYSQISCVKHSYYPLQFLLVRNLGAAEVTVKMPIKAAVISRLHWTAGPTQGGPLTCLASSCWLLAEGLNSYPLWPLHGVAWMFWKHQAWLPLKQDPKELRAEVLRFFITYPRKTNFIISAISDQLHRLALFSMGRNYTMA